MSAALDRAAVALERAREVVDEARGARAGVYVAGGSADRFLVRAFIERLALAGIPVTYDWTRSPGYDRPLSSAEVEEQARKDERAVRRCSTLWYVAPAEKSEGSHYELGIARALGKRVVVSGPATALGRIFPRVAASERYESHEEAFAAVVGGAPAGGGQ